MQMYKDYEIESASQLDDSHVMDVSELIGAPAWDEYYAKLETENPALKALIDDNPDGLR